jgi:hypothetical protein
MAMNSTIFWNVTPYSPVIIYRRFGGTYYAYDNISPRYEHIHAHTWSMPVGRMFTLRMVSAYESDRNLLCGL